jgi:hypothetical protein
MTCNGNQAQIVKQLIDGFRLSKNIIVTCILMYKPDGIVNKIKADYDQIEGILLVENKRNESSLLKKKHEALFDLDSSNSYFLNSTSLVNSLPQLDSSKQDIIAMVSAINIALATYRIFSATQLDFVLKVLFTQVIPVNTDITQRIIIAYSELLHRVAYDKGLLLSWESAVLIQETKAIRPDWVAPYHSQLAEYEEQALDKLKSNIEPMEHDSFIMAWETAFSSMIRQSKVIRNAFFAIPKEIIKASEPTATNEIDLGDDDDEEYFDAVEGDLLGQHELDGDDYFEMNKQLVNIPDNNQLTQENPHALTTQLPTHRTTQDPMMPIPSTQNYTSTPAMPVLKEGKMLGEGKPLFSDSHHQAAQSPESQNGIINELDSPRSQLLTKRKYNDTLTHDDISQASASTNKRLVETKN